MSADAYKDMPGELKMDVIVHDGSDPKYQTSGPDGAVRPFGKTLRQWRVRLGGDEGMVTDPARGGQHLLSLKPYAHLDQDRTYLALSFYFIRDPSAYQPIADAVGNLTPAELAKLEASVDPRFQAIARERFRELSRTDSPIPPGFELRDEA